MAFTPSAVEVFAVIALPAELVTANVAPTAVVGARSVAQFSPLSFIESENTAANVTIRAPLSDALPPVMLPSIKPNAVAEAPPTVKLTLSPAEAPT